MAEVRDQEPASAQHHRALRHARFRRPLSAEEGLDELRELNRTGEPPPARRLLPRRRRPARGRPIWLRAIRWALAALLAWVGLSLILFLISSQSAAGIPASAARALDGGGLPIVSATNILVLGSDARPPGSKEPGANPGGPSRSDTMMLIRTGGGHSARMSIPRDTLVNIPGHGLAKINAAYFYGGPALAIRTVEDFLHIRINHVVLINFAHFPALVNAMGGVDYTGGCVISIISGGFREGGFTLRLRAGTHHLDGAQALALARTRENRCNPSETDLTRELRQQKLILAMKSRILSLAGFIRLPWIAWALPQAIRSDMSGPTLAGVLASLELFGNAHDTLLYPTGAEVYNGEDVLTITPQAAAADVRRFLHS